MAAWLCAAIIVENVDARVEGDRLLVPAGSDFVLEDQVRSVITAVAKTHHYWREHLHRSPRS
jgi:sirohydrochlorin cobaltochelatase